MVLSPQESAATLAASALALTNVCRGTHSRELFSSSQWERMAVNRQILVCARHRFMLPRTDLKRRRRRSGDTVESVLGRPASLDLTDMGPRTMVLGTMTEMSLLEFVHLPSYVRSTRGLV